MHTECYDFDLCENCEALPIPVHPQVHPLLKMKMPDTVMPLVQRAQSTNAPHCTRRDSKERNAQLGDAHKQVEELRAQVAQLLAEKAQLQATTDQVSPVAPYGSSHSVEEVVTMAPKATNSTPAIQVSDIDRSLRRLWRPVNKQMKETIMRATANADTTGGQLQQLLKATENLAINLNVDTTSTSQLPSVEGNSNMAELTIAGLTSLSPEIPAEPARIASVPSELKPDLQYSTDTISAPVITSPTNLRGNFVRDVTIPDGHVLPPGAEFVKVWRMQNDGDRSWPETTELHFRTGTRFSGTTTMLIGEVTPGTSVDVETSELKVSDLLLKRWQSVMLMYQQVPDQPGQYMSYWHLSDGQGQYFGSSIWMEYVTLYQDDSFTKQRFSITVAEMNNSDADASLTSSAVVMPYSGHTRSTVGDNQHVEASVKPSTSHITSVGGSSIGSSVSLISATPSETEDDAAWADSRSHSIPRPSEQGAQAMNYVILYDDNSSSENEE